MNDILSRITSAQSKAGVLVEALPWIRHFAGKTFVIKYGGNAMVSQELRQAFAHDVMFLHHMGIRVVVVHGGGPQINAMLERLGIQSEFRAGLRVTTAEAMDVVRMVLTGQVQRELVSLINSEAPYSVGLSGEDGGLLTARRRTVQVEGETIDLGHVGDIEHVDPTPILELLEAGRIPVISSVAVDAATPREVLNVNADSAAGAIAAALRAEKLMMLTDVEGLYRAWPDKASLVSHITADEVRELLPQLGAGMRPKMEAALQAVDHGVSRSHVIDGRLAHSMLVEVFTDEGIGTEVVAS